MVICFAADCNHKTVKNSCSFFRFPRDKKLFNLWTALSRRADRKPDVDPRLCSCHFKDGKKENGPTLFNRNKSKLFSFPDPVSQKQQEKKDIVELEINMFGGKKMPGNPCSVAICRSNNTRSKGTRFFSFPKDNDVKELWMKRCFGNKPLNYRKMLVCSKHFKPDDFEDEMQARLMGTLPRRLKKTAVPSQHILPPGNMQMVYMQAPHDKKDERIPKPSQEKSKDYQLQRGYTKKNKHFVTELNINMESFIYEIRQRPEIWDVALHDYSIKEKNKDTWDELIDIFIDKKNPSEDEKEHFGQQLQSRWQSIQDTYSRDLKIQKRFGSKKRPVSKFFHRLSFLEDVVGSEENTNNSTEPQDLSSIPSISICYSY